MSASNWSPADTPRLTEYQAMAQMEYALMCFTEMWRSICAKDGFSVRSAKLFHDSVHAKVDEAVRLAELAKRQREAVAAISEALDLFGGMLFRLHDRRPYLGIITARHMHAEMMAQLDTLSARERAGEGE